MDYGSGQAALKRKSSVIKTRTPPVFINETLDFRSIFVLFCAAVYSLLTRSSKGSLIIIAKIAGSA